MRQFYKCGLPVFFLLLLFFTGCGQNQAEDIPSDLMAAIDSFYATIETDDIEARIALFSDEALMLPNHWGISQGRKTIGDGLRSGEGWVFKLRDRKLVDMDVNGSLAYTVNSYDYTYHAEGAEPQWHKTKNVHIWKRDATGAWKLHVDIWNSNVPISEFPHE